jgi:hypothetical protein
VAKPSIDSGQSKGLLRVRFEGGKLLVENTPADLEQLAAPYGRRDFLLQRYLRQHPALGELLAGATTTTVRVWTTRIEDAPLVLAAFVRLSNRDIWRSTRPLPQIISCAIAPSGELGAYGMDGQLQTYASHPLSGVPFAGRAVPGYPAIAKLATSLHGRLDYFDLVVWEFVVTEEEAPVLVDVNLRGSDGVVAQALSGPLFGEHTERVLERVYRSGTPRSTALWPLLR